MRVFTFDPQFHSAVWSGRKSSTIRGSARCKPGDELSLRKWQGKPYGKGVKQLELRSAVCKSVTPISLRLDADGDLVVMYHPGDSARQQKLDAGTLFALAMQEGFDNTEAMKQWFVAHEGISQAKVLIGDLIEW